MLMREPYGKPDYRDRDRWNDAFHLKLRYFHGNAPGGGFAPRMSFSVQGLIEFNQRWFAARYMAIG